MLQDREFTQLGSNRPIEVDVRVLAATNRDLEAMMRAGTFREDLYYRLQVIELRVPPLRERREEIPALVEFFLRRSSRERYRRPPVAPSPRAAARRCSDYAWPGNIRELENMMKRFVVLQDENLLLAELARERSIDSPAPSATPMVAAAGAAVARARRGGRTAGAASRRQRRRDRTARRRLVGRRRRQARASCRSWRAPRRCRPSAKPFRAPSITSAGIAARPPPSSASATRRC